MYKSKKLKILFCIDSTVIDILPAISIYLDERSIVFRWIIFEMDILLTIK